jgi:hypothetical protein
LCEAGRIACAEGGEVLADQQRHGLGQSGRQQRSEAPPEPVHPQCILTLEAPAVVERSADDMSARISG